jgi:hypothetical protein
MLKLINFVVEYDLLVFFAVWFGSAAAAYTIGY